MAKATRRANERRGKVPVVGVVVVGVGDIVVGCTRL
jgi:hypothetical protein